MTDRQRTVALLIDYDNLQICYSRDAPGTQLDLGAVVALAQNYGRVVVARAYAEWNLLSERLAVYKAGIEPAFAPVLRPEGSSREGKSLADTVMVSDGVDLLWTHQPDVLVLVTSDKDMVPLVRIAKQRSCLVVVLGSDLTAVQLIEMANEFITYRHLIKELGRPEQKLPASRIREEPRVRRSREPVGSPEVAAAREASLRQPRTPPGRVRSRPAASALPAPAIAPAVPPPESLAPAGEAAEPGPAEPTLSLLDEHGQPIVTRRRRRRRRRTGSAGTDQVGEGATGQEAAGDEQDERVDLELNLAGELVGGQPPVTEPAPTAERAAAIWSDGVALEVPAPAEPRVEPPALRPWERWPESPVPAPPPARVPRSRRPRPTVTDRPEPAREQAGPATETASESEAPSAESDALSSVERASQSIEAVQAEVASEWSPSAPEGGVPTETEEKPAAPRRPRRRRAPAVRTAVATAGEGGESA